MAKHFRRRGLSYTDYVPGLGAGDNPLGDLTDDETDLPTEPPRYEDPILPGGRPPMPPAETPPAFSPHYMYDPVTGEAFYANTYEDHLRYEALGYVHTRPDTATGGDTGDSGSGGGILGGEKGDFVLIGLASMLFFGSIILGLRRGD